MYMFWVFMRIILGKSYRFEVTFQVERNLTMRNSRALAWRKNLVLISEMLLWYIYKF